MAEIKVTKVPVETKRFLKAEAASRGITLSALIGEDLDKAHPKLQDAAKRRKEKAKP